MTFFEKPSMFPTVPEWKPGREMKNTAGDDLAVFLLLSRTRRRPATVRVLGWDVTSRLSGELPDTAAGRSH
jgi:hypothetical protein